MGPTGNPDFSALVNAVAATLQQQGLPGGTPGLMSTRSPRLDQLSENYREALRQAAVAFDGLVIARPRSLVLPVTLSGSVVTNVASFTTPSDEVLLIHECRGHLLLNVEHSETAGFGALTSTAVSELIIAKAVSAQVTLSLNGQTTPLILNGSWCLADILGVARGQPVRFDVNNMGWVIPPSSQIMETVTLTDANVVGQSTEYGVILNGVGLQLAGRR